VSLRVVDDRNEALYEERLAHLVGMPLFDRHLHHDYHDCDDL
jgi:hypothetical protein